MSYTREELTSLKRQELQKLSKQCGIKANKKNLELVEDLLIYFDDLHAIEKKLESELKECDKEVESNANKKITTAAAWMSDDEEISPQKIDTIKADLMSDDEEMSSPKVDTMKADLMKEVEKRAQEKMTKIPKFKAENVDVSRHLMSPASKGMFMKKHSKEFKKLDSIDVYIEKKRKRAELHATYHKKLKLDAEKTLNKMKLTHNTPARDENITKRKSKGATPIHGGKLIRNNTFVKSTYKAVDKEVTFNFVSSLKSPKSIFRTSPRLNALKEKDTNVKMSTTQKSNPGAMRKSVQFTNLTKPKLSLSGKNVNKLNTTMSDLRSPGFSTAPNSGKKTPAKFDLQASLKKRLSYKPHTGKLKETYLPDCNSLGACQRGDANKSLNTTNANKSLNTTQQKRTVTQQKTSVKEITKKVSTRDKRREAATKRRVNKRDDMLTKRRGVVC